MPSVADSLLGPPSSPNTGSTQNTENTAPEADSLRGKWEYAFFIINVHDPKRTFVMLRQVAKEISPTRLSHRASVIGAARRGHRRSLSVPKAAKITFFVNEGRITDEELGVDFVAVSADERELRYTLPGDPVKIYSLEFSPYYKHHESGKIQCFPGSDGRQPIKS
jgi:hypothetical protein